MLLSTFSSFLTVDTAEVQHAKAHHLALVAEAKAKVSYGGHHYAPAPAHYSAPSAYGHHYPIIGHNGVPEDTPEVKHEKAKHFALVAEAQSKASYGGHHNDGSYAPHHGQYDDGSYDSRYENEHYYH